MSLHVIKVSSVLIATSCSLSASTFVFTACCPSALTSKFSAQTFHFLCLPGLNPITEGLGDPPVSVSTIFRLFLETALECRRTLLGIVGAPRLPQFLHEMLRLGIAGLYSMTTEIVSLASREPFHLGPCVIPAVIVKQVSVVIFIFLLYTHIYVRIQISGNQLIKSINWILNKNQINHWIRIYIYHYCIISPLSKCSRYRLHEYCIFEFTNNNKVQSRILLLREHFPMQ